MLGHQLLLTLISLFSKYTHFFKIFFKSRLYTHVYFKSRFVKKLKKYPSTGFLNMKATNIYFKKELNLCTTLALISNLCSYYYYKT